MLTVSGEHRIKDFVHLPGQNCVTTAIRNIINYYGFRYRESMVFGLAEGLGFQFKLLETTRQPFLNGVSKGLVESFCRNLHLTFEELEFDSDEAAMDDLKSHIDRQIPVIVQLDLFHLPYFEPTTHFAGHRVVPIGYDTDFIYLSDTGYDEVQSCPIDSFIEARKSAYPPFTPNRKRTRIQQIQERPFIEEMVTKALYNLNQRFGNHLPGNNLLQIFDLRDHLDAYKSPELLFTQIEKAGTGGGLGRKMFADFLDQSAQMYGRSIYDHASVVFEESAKLWREIALSAKRGSFDGIPTKLESIYKYETEGIRIFSDFHAEDI